MTSHKAGGFSRSKVTTLALMIGLAAAVLLLDQSAKWVVVHSLSLGEKNRVIGELLIFQYVNNPGAAFGIGGGATWIFSILAVVTLFVVSALAPRIRSVWWAMMFGLLLGGLLGNLTDRIFREPGVGVGHVVDFISTPWLLPAVYNIADMSIVGSMIMLAILMVCGIHLDGSRGKRVEQVESLPEHRGGS